MVIAASGILLKDKKILLIKRSDYTTIYPNYWACPGGRAENNETPEMTVMREVKEEVNLDFIPTQLFTTATWQDRDLYRYLGNWQGKIKIQEEEVTNYGWFSYMETKKLALAFDYARVIELLNKKELL